MSVEVRNHQGRFVPVCFCDICNERITDAGMGMVLFPKEGGEGKGEKVDFLLLCKGKCDRVASECHGEDGGWLELSSFLAYLATNVGLDGGKIDRFIEINGLMETL